MNRYSLEDVSLCLTHISKNRANRAICEKKLSENFSEKNSEKTQCEKQQIVP